MNRRQNSWVSWPIAAFVVGLLTQATWRRFNLGYAFLANVVGGILVVYAIGIPFTSVYADVSLTTSLVGSFSFIPGDLVKALIAALVADGVRRSYPVIELPARQPAHS